MKRSANNIIYSVALIATVFISTTLHADPIDHMHAAIKHLFKAKYTEAKHTHWTYLENGITEADFILNEKEESVFYNASGELIETDAEVRWLDVPRQARIFIYDNFDGCYMKHIIKVENKNEELYKIVLVRNGVEHKFKFDKDGVIIGGYSLD